MYAFLMVPPPSQVVLLVPSEMVDQVAAVGAEANLATAVGAEVHQVVAAGAEAHRRLMMILAQGLTGGCS